MRVLLALLLLWAAPVAAEPPPPPDVPLADAGAEARARAIMHGLRCLTCQNQSIADSGAGQAQAMRAEVRQQVAAGASDAEVRAWFVDRYGDWVSYAPPARGGSLLLWAAPLLFLALGALLVARRFRR